MARKIAVLNHKGGVGKSTTAVNLALALAHRRKRVLLVDYDSQANASMFLGLFDKTTDPEHYNSTHLTLGERPFAPVRDVLVPGLDVVVSSTELIQLDLHPTEDLETGSLRLSRAIAAVEPGYDFVLVDCAPSLGRLGLNPMAACNELLIPIKMEPASIPGALSLHDLATEGLSLNPELRILGVLGTFYQESGKMSRDVLEKVKTIFGRKVFSTTIHAAQAVARAAGEGQPIYALSPKDRASEEYDSLAKEVIARGK